MATWFYAQFIDITRPHVYAHFITLLIARRPALYGSVTITKESSTNTCA